MRRLLTVLSLVLICGYWSAASVRAASGTLAYGGLRACYTSGSAPPSFTLTARVDTTDVYRMTHTVVLEGGAPETPETVYSGVIEAGKPHTVVIAGGAVAVPGTYRLAGALYVASSNTLVAQTSATVQAALVCATPTPEPPPPTPPGPAPTPHTETHEPPPDIRWSQAISQSQSLSGQPLLAVAVRGKNIGRGSGRGDAVLSYDPTALRLLDATQHRASDWVRAHDGWAGAITLALGDLAPGDQTTILVRFLVLKNTTTAVRLTREDGQDRGNPLFPNLADLAHRPITLTAQRADTTLVLTGRGYKPGEALSVWSNMKDGRAVAVEGVFVAADDDDGSLNLSLLLPSQDILSVVVYGRASDAVGVANITLVSEQQ